MMTTSNDNNDNLEPEELYDGPSKSQLKRESHHMVDVGEEILKLSSQDIRSLQLPEELDAAIKMLTEAGFRVHSISFDGHSTNVSYYNSLQITENWCFPNPYNELHAIFIYFDPVHLWKNMYNSFQNKSSIHMPRCPGLEVSWS